MFALCLALFLVALLGRLGHPLLWQDEAETAMFGRRILEHGIPKVHGEEGVVYGMSVPMAFAVDAESDAYTGSLWGQYYVGALAVALSDLATDDHARTALVRLPFALAGMLGLWLLWRAHAPAFGPPARRMVFASAYLLALASSVSLVLHLREARYYPLVMALVGALVWLHRRAHGPARGVGIALALFGLFNVFYPAAVAMAVWIALEQGLAWLAARRAPDPALATAPPTWADWLPLLAAAVAVLPLVVWFRMGPLAELMSARYRFGFGDYATNVLVLTRHLLQHEALIAAALLRLAALLVARGVPGPAPAPAHAPALWRAVIVWSAIGARNPIFFERYFVALGPLLVMAALLDFERVRQALVAGGGGVGSRRRALVSLAVVCVVGSLAARSPQLVGRARELRSPVEGPLDVAIPWVRARFADGPPPLVATNYEAESWMFYLRAPVVGRFHAEAEGALRAEAMARPDVVVPRRGYPQRVERLRGYLQRGTFDRHVLDVADLPYNTIPELSRGRVLTLTHPFQTVRPAHPGEALEVWVRRPGSDDP